jgi:hypothetical protein
MKKNATPFNYPAKNGKVQMRCPVYTDREFYVGGAGCVIKCGQYTYYSQEDKTISCANLNKAIGNITLNQSTLSTK